ncbi:hypothetical protein COBT_000261 [Conglomerata obtusa]
MNLERLNVLLFCSLFLRIYNSNIRSLDNVNPKISGTSSLECKTHSDKINPVINDENVFNPEIDIYIKKLDDHKKSLKMDEYKSIFESCYYNNTVTTHDTVKEASVIEIVIELNCFLKTVLEKIRAFEDLKIIYLFSSNYLEVLYMSILLNSDDILKRAFLFNMLKSVSTVLFHLFLNITNDFKPILLEIGECIEALSDKYRYYKFITDQMKSTTSKYDTESHKKYFMANYLIFYANYIENNSVDLQKLAIRAKLLPEISLNNLTLCHIDRRPK